MDCQIMDCNREGRFAGWSGYFQTRKMTQFKWDEKVSHQFVRSIETTSTEGIPTKGIQCEVRTQEKRKECLNYAWSSTGCTAHTG